MNIGILTYHRAINYGAFLQAFALKTFLEKLHHNVEFIDYMPTAHAEAYKPFYINPNIKGINKLKALVWSMLKYSRYKKRLKKMQRIQQKLLKISKHPLYVNGTELSNINYDCIIYGSDQIWWKHSPIPRYNGFDNVYWGHFIKPEYKKIAYAPSMGIIDLNEDDKVFITDSLKRFSAISVRETPLKNVLCELTSNQITVVLDPVFLLSKEEWEVYAQRPTPKEKYILLYQLMISPEAEKLAKKKALETGYRLIEITGNVNPLKIGSKYFQTADSLDLISYIRNAEYVISTSFHGVAFSIIFEKQFIALGMGANSGRVGSLLQILHIENKLLDTSQNNTSDKTDYNSVKPILEQQRNISINYLTKAIE